MLTSNEAMLEVAAKLKEQGIKMFASWQDIWNMQFLSLIHILLSAILAVLMLPSFFTGTSPPSYKPQSGRRR